MDRLSGQNAGLVLRPSAVQFKDDNFLDGGYLLTCHKTRTQWINELNHKFSDKFDYSSVPEDVHCRDKVKIICPIHGAFIQSMSNHLRGCGCVKCKFDEWRKTPEERADSKRAYEVTEENRSRRKRYYASNKTGIIKAAVLRNNKRYHSIKHTPDEKVKRTCRSLVQRVTLASRGVKGSNTEAVLGYGFAEFQAHIESMFEPWMTWGNHGRWHLDHIKPISLFISEGTTDPQVVNALSNLRPIAAADNLRKGDSYAPDACL